MLPRPRCRAYPEVAATSAAAGAVDVAAVAPSTVIAVAGPPALQALGRVPVLPHRHLLSHWTTPRKAAAVVASEAHGLPCCATRPEQQRGARQPRVEGMARRAPRRQERPRGHMSPGGNAQRNGCKNASTKCSTISYGWPVLWVLRIPLSHHLRVVSSVFSVLLLRLSALCPNLLQPGPN